MKKITDNFKPQKVETQQPTKPNVVIAPKLQRTREVLDKYGNVIKVTKD